MGLNLDNVPEKGHFTISEISERWKVDKSVVEHFVFEKGLRLAAYTRDLGIAGLLVSPEGRPNMEFIGELGNFLIKTCEDIQLNKAGGSLFPYELRNKEITFSEENVRTPNTILSKQEYPKYLYLHFGLDKQSLPIIATANLFGGHSVFILADYKIDVITGNYFDLVFFAIRKKIFKYITREERDRFEKEYGITTETENVEQKVSAKAENKMLEVIQTLASCLLDSGLSENPFTDAEKILKKLSIKSIEATFAKETLAKYLKKNRK